MDDTPLMPKIVFFVLLLGIFASAWMVVSLSTKLYQRRNRANNTDIDWILLLISISDVICCTIKASYRYSAFHQGFLLGHGLYPFSNFALMTSLTWQATLALFILHIVKNNGKIRINIWVVHLFVISLAITRVIQGYFENVVVFTYYATAVYVMNSITVCILLFLVSRELKGKSKNKRRNALVSRIRLFPIVHLCCMIPRQIYVVYMYASGREPEDHPILFGLINSLFFSFPLLNSIVYGASRSCFSFQFRKQESQADPNSNQVSIDKDSVRFNQTDIIGRGGAGVIYKGVYRGSTVAIKRIRLSLFGLDGPISEEYQSMFMQEANMLRRLVHPNIVYFMGAYIDGTDGYIVVEYCNRGSLRSILDRLNDKSQLRQSKWVDWNWRCKIALCTARGLLYLHQTATPTIVHRDLKSPNVLVCDYYAAKVADLGTARLISIASEALNHSAAQDQQMTNVMTTQLGTARWTAPEIVEGFSQGHASYSEAVDIYSFGLILWELTTFELPFSKLHYNVEVHEAILCGERPIIPPPCAYRPAEWDDLMTSCWAQSPNDRPQAAQVVERLESILASMTQLKALVQQPTPPPSVQTKNFLNRVCGRDTV